MSLLIKGMKMPKDCRECLMQVYYSSGKTWCKPADRLLAEDYKPIPFDGRPDWCPMVELPEKHGRLIDGDELFKQMNIAIDMMSGMMKAIGAEDDEGMQMELKAYRDIRDGIKDYETVIEAEDKE